MKIYRSATVFFLFFLISNISGAEYLAALQNHDVCSEIANDKDRKITRGDWFCLGFDSVAFLRALGRSEYYHGFGHWSQLRSEFKINELSSLNLRSVFFSGSSSNGYAQPSGYFTLYSLESQWPEKLLNGTLKVRILDQDRLTTGLGLFVQDKESNGGRLDWIFENYRFTFKGESTGGFMIGDDLYNYEIKENNSLFGAGIVLFPAGSQSGLSENRKPYYYMFSSMPTHILDLQTEIGHRNKAWAGLLKISKTMESENYSANLEMQSRKYENHFAEQIAGQIDHQYISLDQLDKTFMNAINIFVVNDHVQAGSVNLNLSYRLDSNHKWSFQNEFVHLDYSDLFKKDFLFFRAEYSYSPIPNRDDSLVFFLSNKALAQSEAIPPFTISLEDTEPLFKPVDYVGLEGRFRF